MLSTKSWRHAVLFKLLIVFLLVDQTVAHDRNLSLWKITNHDNVVYILGSIHAMKEDMYPLPGPVMEAFRTSEITVFEVNLMQIDRGKIAEIMKARGSYEPPASIYDDLSIETEKLLADYLRESNIGVDQVRYLKPWHLTLNIGVMEFSRLGYKTKLGLDHHLQQLAVEHGKEIQELETFDQQIELLSNDSLAIQDLSLRVSLRDRAEIGEELESMVAAWRNGDADLMYQLTMDSVKEYPELQGQMNRLVLSRNIKMVGKIRSYLTEGRNYLVVAGSLHMGGAHGIINLLAKDYEVEQLSY